MTPGNIICPLDWFTLMKKQGHSTLIMRSEIYYIPVSTEKKWTILCLIRHSKTPGKNRCQKRIVEDKEIILAWGSRCYLVNRPCQVSAFIILILYVYIYVNVYHQKQVGHLTTQGCVVLLMFSSKYFFTSWCTSFAWLSLFLENVECWGAFMIP